MLVALTNTCTSPASLTCSIKKLEQAVISCNKKGEKTRTRTRTRTRTNRKDTTDLSSNKDSDEETDCDI